MSYLERYNWINYAILACFVPILIPTIQFGLVYKLWSEFDFPVNRRECKNSCWDTTFKAGYESGVGRYHHIYFNVTWQTFVIWTITVFAIVAMYEAAKYIFILISRGQARYKMLVAFSASIFPNFYGWWMYFNYYNDDFYSQFWHQLFFSITEFVSTLFILHLIDTKNPLTKKKINAIIGIALVHIFIASWDQFIVNVIKGQGKLHQVIRDLGFMFPDIINVALPWLEFREFNNLGLRLP